MGILFIYIINFIRNGPVPANVGPKFCVTVGKFYFLSVATGAAFLFSIICNIEEVSHGCIKLHLYELLQKRWYENVVATGGDIPR